MTAEKTSPMMTVAMRVEVRENPLLLVLRGFRREVLYLLCMGVWAYGRMGVWAYGRMGVWAYGRMGVWAYHSLMI